jgi:hypothetical protein
MRILLFHILLFPSLLVAQAGQPSGKRSTSKSAIQPQRLESNEMKPEPAMMQASDEAAEFSSVSKQPSIWLNEYTAQRNNFTATEGFLSKAEDTQLNALVSEAEQSISGSFEMSYMQLRQNRNKAIAGELLKEAVKKGGLSNNLLLPEMAWIAERSGDKAARSRALDAYKSAGQISTAQTILSKMSITAAGNGALIITNGEFDSYPLWHVAPDAHVVSLAMLEDKAWLKRKLGEWDPSFNANSIENANDLLKQLRDKSSKPVYVSLSLRPDLLNRYAESLFPLGPLARLLKTEVDLTNQLKAFYLSTTFETELLGISSTDSYARAAANLLPGLVTLYRSGNRLTAEERVKVKALIALVSSKSGKKIAYE